jgi:hypothetical protein
MSVRRLALGIVVVLAGALLSAPSAVSGGEPEQATERAARLQTFLLLEVGTDNDGDGTEEQASRVVGKGPIHAMGKSVRLGPRRDRFVFPQGNLVVRHKPRAGSEHETFDDQTCLFTFRERGTWRVVRGTGIYADARGHGRYRVRGYGIACTFTHLFSSRVRAVGVLRF